MGNRASRWLMEAAKKSVRRDKLIALGKDMCIIERVCRSEAKSIDLRPSLSP